MKKNSVLNLIKYHVERNENGFRNEAINIARYFDSIGDNQLAEYIMSLIAESNLYIPQKNDFESEFLKPIDTQNVQPLCLPSVILEDIKGIINAVNYNIGINKFLFEGLPGSGKTEAVKQVARLLNVDEEVVNAVYDSYELLHRYACSQDFAESEERVNRAFRCRYAKHESAKKNSQKSPLE